MNKHFNSHINRYDDKLNTFGNKFEEKAKIEEQIIEQDWSEFENVEILLAEKLKKDEQIFFDIESYQEIGRGILMAIKAMWDFEKNSILKLTPYGSIKVQFPFIIYFRKNK